MLRLRRYLKPFIVGFTLAIVLLFVQAFCDLNLPNFMSDIVNIGIQQNGIKTGAPDAVSVDGINFIKLFMNDSEKKIVEQNYTLTSIMEKNPENKTYSSLYPEAKDQIYVINQGLSQETLEDISLAFGSSGWTMINVMKSSSRDANVQNASSLNMSELYSLAPIIASIPENIILQAKDRALSMEKSIIMQTSTSIVSGFYSELGVSMASYQSKYIVNVGMFMLLVALISGVSTILVSFISSRVAAGVARNLRNDIFKKVGEFSNSEFDKYSTASLITRSTNDVTQIQQFLTMGIRMICYAPIMGIGGIVMALRKSTSMSWIIALACISIIGLIVIIFSVVMPKVKSMQKFIDKLNLVARETLNGLMVVRAFGNEDFEKKRFDDANKDLSQTNLFVNRAMAFMMPAMTLIMNGVTLLIIWVGSEQVAMSAMQVGDMMAFMQYAMQIIMSFLMISMMFIFIPRASVSAVRISEILETQPAVKNPKNPKTISSSEKGRVEFRNVSFRYSGAEEDAVSNISFISKPGETTAFIGATGSGKSTIVNLIPRFYDATEGEVIVNGVNVKEISQHELRSHIGYVPQKSVLLTGTIASNIKYGNENASEDILQTSARIAQASNFINEKVDGFNSMIAQGGSNVSGGQKQRLSIARALAVNPDIYIFDDSFSALDFKTDSTLRAALKECTSNSTVLIVAQRVSTIMSANQIFVIEDGKIVGSGTHKQLLKNCPEYYEIASSQLSKEELENA